MAFISAILWAIAARLTERCSDQATSDRHRSTQAPRNPRIAPTQIKTVPSGRLDFCIKGAAFVLGTTIAGIPTPANVGRPSKPPIRVGVTSGKPSLLVALATLVAAASDVGFAELWGVFVAEAGLEDAAALVAVAFAVSPGPSGWLSVARSGRLLLLLLLLSCARAMGAATSSRPRKVVEGRIVK
jgi:hypothetical protein